MNQKKIQTFAILTCRQMAGDQTVIDDIYSLNPTLEDGCCLYNTYEQWKGAFSFFPGAVKALPAICSLAKKINSYESDDTLRMYSEPEWKEIIEYRGPFECAIRNTCSDCNKQYVRFGQSGFDDRYPSICKLCGDVWLQSGYDEDPLPKCQCGGRHTKSGCIHCGCKKIRESECFSSFEYFIKHNWTEKNPQK